MNWPEMEFGESVAGLLIDGVEGTPYVGATFRLTDPQGVIVEVPYLSRHEAPQFENVDEWFSQQSPPANMIMRTPEGSVSMFDVAWSGHSENWGGGKASIGKLRPHEVVFAHREGLLADPLTLKELHSQVDALSRWSRANAITTQSETDEEGRVQAVNIRMVGGSVLSWQQGDAKMELVAHWTHSPVRDGVASVTTLHDIVTLVSTFEPGPRPFWDHFVEQRKVATLLVFLFGKPISFRKHQIRDDRFPARLGGGGEVYNVPLRELLSRNTIGERGRPVPTPDELGQPLLFLAGVAAEGLTAWSEAYEPWARFILPSAGVLNRRGAFVEDVVLSTSLSLEAAGGLLGVKDGEDATYWRKKPTTATYAYRCLHELGLDWPDRIESIAGLARAIANNYNGLKHADRGEFPDQIETFLISHVNRFIVRAVAVSLTSSSSNLREAFQQSREMSGVAELFHNNGMRIFDDGSWADDPDAEIEPESPGEPAMAADGPSD